MSVGKRFAASIAGVVAAAAIGGGLAPSAVAAPAASEPTERTEPTRFVDVVVDGSADGEARAARVWDRKWKMSHKGTVRARAKYDDERNRLWLADRKKDGHSVVFVAHPKKAKVATRYWVIGGKGTKGRWKVYKAKHENRTFKFKICHGEWAKRHANRRVFHCNTKGTFKR